MAQLTEDIADAIDAQDWAAVSRMCESVDVSQMSALEIVEILSATIQVSHFTTRVSLAERCVSRLRVIEPDRAVRLTLGLVGKTVEMNWSAYMLHNSDQRDFVKWAKSNKEGL